MAAASALARANVASVKQFSAGSNRSIRAICAAQISAGGHLSAAHQLGDLPGAQLMRRHETKRGAASMAAGSGNSVTSLASAASTLKAARASSRCSASGCSPSKTAAASKIGRSVPHRSCRFGGAVRRRHVRRLADHFQTGAPEHQAGRRQHRVAQSHRGRIAKASCVPLMNPKKASTAPIAA